MKKLIILILFSVLSISCSSIELSEEQKAKSRAKVEKKIGEISEKYSGPIFLLISSSCSYKSKFNNWPININHPGKASLFSEYQVKSEEPYEVHFKFKEDPFNWELVLNQQKQDQKCAFQLIGKKESGTSFIDINHSYDIEKIKTIDTEQYISESTALAAQMYFPIIFAEIMIQAQQKEILEEERSNYEKITSDLGNILLVFAICAILDVDPSNCDVGTHSPMTAYGESKKSTNNYNSEEEELEQKLREKFGLK